MKYVIDLDGTLCTIEKSGYTFASPIESRINKVNKLFDEGNEIIIFTARGMNTFKGNKQKVYEQYYDFTVEQLKKWQVKYTSLILGKPSADFYIDDKGIHPDEFFK
jgi:capsule biosynthesis phosphatase